MDVVIVGAGPAGAALAYLLARRGVGVTLLERHRDFEREFRGEGLMPSGSDALRQMGLGAELDSLPQTQPRALEVYRGERRLARIDLGRDGLGVGGPIVVSQPAMLGMLVDRAARFGSFRVRFGAIARDLVRDGRRVVGVLADTSDGEREVRGDLVIATDGRSSVLRRRSDLLEERVRQTFDVVWCKVPSPRFLTDGVTARAYLGSGHAALMFPSYDSRLQIGWIIEKGTFGDVRSRGIDAWLEDLQGHVSADIRAHLIQKRDEITQPFVLDVVCDRLPQWSVPGLLLLGDAAHPMSPVGAQGINIALRDALVAANELVPVHDGSGSADAIDAASRRIQEQRMPEVEAIQKLQQYPPRVLFGSAWWSRFLVDFALPILLRSGVAQRVALPTARILASGKVPVRLRV